MHAFSKKGQPDSGVILGNGQPPRARSKSVFVAECLALDITAVDVDDWIYDTAVREAWNDFNTAAERIAKAVVAAQAKA